MDVGLMKPRQARAGGEEGVCGGKGETTNKELAKGWDERCFNANNRWCP